MKDTTPRILAVGFVALLVAAAMPAEAQGYRVEFAAVKFDDTLFTSIDAPNRVAFDDAGDIWYTTAGGLVHVRLDDDVRTLYTRADGLPSSFTLGVATKGDLVYVGTDLGLAVVDRSDQSVRAVTPANSPLHDEFVKDVAIVGDDVWIGTYFHGVAVWDTASDTWAFKNTSTNHASPHAVQRVIPTEESVWVTTLGNGVWRYDRSAGGIEDASAWSSIILADGLPSWVVLSVAERGDEVWFGTDKGLARWNQKADEWRVYTTKDGLPQDRVVDVDVMLTADGTHDVFASTREGIWQLQVDTGRSTVLRQSFGIHGERIFDNVFDEAHGWAIATMRGVSLLRASGWSYYVTGPSEGVSPGPGGSHFTSASVGNRDQDFIWFGHTGGISAFNPAAADGRGAWINLGEWQYYPGSIVNQIATDEGITWLATNHGVFGYVHASGEWIERLARAPSRNLVYGIEASRGEIWVPVFGEGLLYQHVRSGESRAWDDKVLPDVFLTDVRADDQNVWLGTGSGLTRLHRTAGTVLGHHGPGDGFPGFGTIYRLMPDGGQVWVGMKSDGFVRFDIATGQVTKVWNAVETPGFPLGEVRAIHREADTVWLGTTEGLVAVDVRTHDFEVYNVTNTPLVANYVNGITARDGILYAATISGVSRMDLATREFLPMADGEGVVRHTGSSSSSAQGFSVTIDAPRDGRAVTGTVEITGRALSFEAPIDHVEVRIGEGAWTKANGTSQWSYTWDTTQHESGSTVVVGARATSGENVTRVREVSLIVVALPTVPLGITHTPPSDVTAGRGLGLAVQAQGDEPLSVGIFYQRPGESTFTRLPTTREGGLFTAIVPARHVQEGTFTYYVEARSGLLTLTDPEDPARPHKLDVGPPPRRAVDIEAPERLTAQAGTVQDFELKVTNTGTEPAVFVVEAAGLRSSWVQMSGSSLTVEPGQTREITATVAVPAAAFADETTLSFRVRHDGGEAEPVTVSMPLSVLAAAIRDADAIVEPSSRGFLGVPGPGALLVGLGLAGAAALRRRLR